MESPIVRIFAAAAANLQALPPAYLTSVDAAVHLLATAFEEGGTLLLFGNGGSAADAEHIAAELVGRFARDRQPLPAIALTSNQAVLTAWSNDHGFEHVFARQVEALGRRGDVVWGISTSGNSANVVQGLTRARALGMKTVGLTGQDGGALAGLCDVLIAVPLTDTPRIQEVHVVTYHAICAALEDRLFAISSDPVE